MRTFLLAPVLLLAACSSDDASSAGGGRDAARRAATADGASPSAPPTIRTFPQATQAFMKSALHQFSAQDPRWETTRREWLALGQREAEFLVQQMWGALLAAQTRNAPDLVERARHELALIGEPSVPLMCEVLTTGTVLIEDPRTGEPTPVSIDDLQRREAAEVLAIIGAPAVRATVEALGRAQAKGGKRFALQALGNMGDRGGPEAARALTTYTRDDELILRIEAVRGLRNWKDQATLDTLVGALADAEDLVRIEAAASLVAREAVSAVPALRAAAATARARAEGHVGEGHLNEARKMDRAAELLSKPRTR